MSFEKYKVGNVLRIDVGKYLQDYIGTDICSYVGIVIELPSCVRAITIFFGKKRILLTPRQFNWQYIGSGDPINYINIL